MIEKLMITSDDIETNQKKFIAYETVFMSDSGKFVLEDLKEFVGIDGPCLDKCVDGLGRVDPMRMAFADGERNILSYVINILEAYKEWKKLQA